MTFPKRNVFKPEPEYTTEVNFPSLLKIERTSQYITVFEMLWDMAKLGRQYTAESEDLKCLLSITCNHNTPTEPPTEEEEADNEL